MNLTHGFTVRETETILGRKFKIDRLGSVSSVINTSEYGLIPVSSNKEFVRSDHSDVFESIEQTFKLNISMWNTLSGLERHIRRRHLYLMKPFTVEQVIKMPLEKAVQEASIRMIKLYKEESVLQTPLPERTWTKLVHICYKTLKVSLTIHQNVISTFYSIL